MDESEELVPCNNCKAMIRPTDGFCPACGAKNAQGPSINPDRPLTQHDRRSQRGSNVGAVVGLLIMALIGLTMYFKFNPVVYALKPTTLDEFQANGAVVTGEVTRLEKVQDDVCWVKYDYVVGAQKEEGFSRVTNDAYAKLSVGGPVRVEYIKAFPDRSEIDLESKRNVQRTVRLACLVFAIISGVAALLIFLRNLRTS
jgi:hypothetical protein